LGTLTGGVSLAHGDSQMNALINALTAGGVQAGSEYLQSLSPASRQVLVHRLGQFLDTAAVGAAFRGNYGIGAGAFGAGQAVRTPWFQNLFSMAPRIAPAVVPPALGVMNVLNPSPSSEK
jgi:hypothetical protein